MTDKLDGVRKMLGVDKGVEPLSILLNKKTGRIKSPYNADLNHAWYIVGLIYYKQGSIASALSAFKKSYRHWSEDIAAIRAIGNCYSDLGNPRMAKFYFSKAINTGGKNYKDLDILIYNLGNAYFDLKKYDLAIAEYKKVRKKDKTTYSLAQKNIKHAQKKIKA
jgi:tetratricopeptide (TPR) repeat protein